MNYEWLRDTLSRLNGQGEYLRRDYEDLRRDYEDLRRDYEHLRRDYEHLRRRWNRAAETADRCRWAAGEVEPPELSWVPDGEPQQLRLA